MPDQATPTVTRVLVATDRSPSSERAVRWAAQLAAANQAELLLLQVLVPPAEGDGAAVPEDVTRVAGEALELFAQRVADGRGRALVVVDEDPAAAILGAAEREHADVLVVGNVGMSGRKQFLLANIPNRISHNARCTVVIVNSAEPAPGPWHAPAALHAVQTDAALIGRALRIGRVFLRAGVRELRSRRGARHRGGGAGARGALPVGVGRTRPDVRQARTDPLDASRPVAGGLHRRAGAAPGAGDAAHRARGDHRPRAGAGRALGGRVREHRATAAGGRDNRAGAPGHAGDGRARGREGAAAHGRAGHPPGPASCSSGSHAGREPGRVPAGVRRAGDGGAPLRPRCGGSSTSARRRQTSSGCARC